MTMISLLQSFLPTIFRQPEDPIDPRRTETSRHNPEPQREETEYLQQTLGGAMDKYRTAPKERKERQEAKEAEATIMRQEIERLKEKEHNLKKELEDSKSQNGDEIQRLTRRLKEEERSHKQTIELLASRTLELGGAQAFLTKADSLSGAEVINLVESLNSEIQQVACTIADSSEFEGCIGLGEEFSKMEESLVHLLGEKMVQMLRSLHGDDLALVVQIALQLCMVGWFLTSMYDKIRGEEDQAVFGRWRALTRVHFRMMFPEESPMNLKMVMDNMTDILVFVGGGSRPKVEKLLVDEFVDRMATTGKAVSRLHRAVGEDVTSSDLITVCVPPNTQFDPATMDDTYAGGLRRGRRERKPISGQVLCTCGLGLLRCVKTSRGGKEPGWKETILLKPRIALDSLLAETTT